MVPRPSTPATQHTGQDGPHVRTALRNRPLGATHQAKQAFEVNGTRYSVGQFVELTEPEADYGIKFMVIKGIRVYKETADVVIRGLPYARTRHLVRRLPRKQNEVCLVLEIDGDDERSEEDQALITISSEQILRTRTFINTNKSFPACRFDEVAYPTKTAREDKAPLTCRWKMRIDYRDHQHRTTGRWSGGAMLHMAENDHGIKNRNLGLDKKRLRAWRGQDFPGTPVSHIPDDVEAGQSLGDHEPHPTYSLADILCGSGGISRGAQMAGLKVVAAVDPCLVACDTYTANFPDTRLYEIDVTEFIEAIDHPHVDILHISPNLQAREKDGEANSEAITAFGKLLDTLRPCILTMDLNPVLGSDANTSLFGSLIQVGTSRGFSVQWKILPLVEHGLSQLTWKRLFIIGAAPGEELPPWPKATHSSDPEGDQHPYVTIREVICDLNPDIHTLHDPTGFRVLRRVPRPENLDMPLNGTMPISGTPFIHPSGSREYTLKELTSLHGFPVEHHFEGAYIKKQIGTAFPPSVARVIFQHLQQWFKRLDGAEPCSSDAPRKASQSENAGRRGKESRVQVGAAGSRNTVSMRHEPSEQSSSPPSPSASSIPTVSVFQNTPMRQTPTLGPEPPATLLSSGKSELGIDSLVPDASPSVTSSRGPDTPGITSSPRVVSAHKRYRREFHKSLNGDDVDDMITETLETPSKRGRYSSPLNECYQQPRILETTEKDGRSG